VRVLRSEWCFDDQETLPRLRQRTKPAVAASSAAAAHVPGSGTAAPPVIAPMLLIAFAG